MNILRNWNDDDIKTLEENQITKLRQRSSTPFSTRGVQLQSFITKLVRLGLSSYSQTTSELK